MIRRFAVAGASLAFVPLAFALAQSGGGTVQPASTGLVQLPATTAVTPAPSPTPTPKPTSSVVATTTTSVVTAPVTLAKLAPLNLSDMRLWNWNGKWHASEWNNGFSTIPWRYNRVARQTNGDVRFRLDSTGAPQLQAQGGTPAYSRGLWEVDATIPALREGMVVAPLWLYDSASKDEIDFEFVGRRGLDVSLHAYPGGVHKQSTVRLFAGTDLSGKRMRFGIRLDQTAGTATMLVDGKAVHTFDKTKLGWFVSEPVKPFIELWAANPKLTWLTAWTGTWAPLKNGEHRTMTVHGYGYTPIA